MFEKALPAKLLPAHPAPENPHGIMVGGGFIAAPRGTLAGLLSEWIFPTWLEIVTVLVDPIITGGRRWHAIVKESEQRLLSRHQCVPCT
jgi:hypothetical protein